MMMMLMTVTPWLCGLQVFAISTALALNAYLSTSASETDMHQEVEQELRKQFPSGPAAQQEMELPRSGC